MLHKLVNWLRGIGPLEEETWRLIELRKAMSASEWLKLASPHYDLLVEQLMREGKSDSSS